MNIKDRVLAFIGFTPDNQNTIEAALLDEGLTYTDTYDNTVELIKVKRAAVQVMKILLTTPDTVNENGYTIKFDRASLLKRIADLEAEIEPVLGPGIRNKSYLW